MISDSGDDDDMMLMMAMILNGSSNCCKLRSGLSNAIRVVPGATGKCAAWVVAVVEVNAYGMTDVSVLV